MRRLVRNAVFLALAASAGAAAAQEPSAPADPSQIIVQGTRERNREIAEFVGALTEARFGTQLARFDWAVCPAAVGLPQNQNDEVGLRMRRVAAEAGIPVGEAGCRPNVLVIAARDKRALIEELQDEYPAYFTDIPRRQVRRLARDPGPAAAWHVETLVGGDGRPIERDILTGQYILETSADASRLRSPTRPQFVAAVVVVELDALAGLTTTQLADYAAMRAFARTDPSNLEGSTAPTILNVLHAPMGSEVPITLTQWDLSFLRAFYASSNENYANIQRRRMQRLVRDDLERAQERESD